MKLWNFDIGNTKFIYKIEDNRRNLGEIVEKGRLTSFNTAETSDKARDILDRDIAGKSREILTGLNRSKLIDDLSKKKELFEDGADMGKVLENVQMHLQQSSIENLSSEEWQKVMGELKPEIDQVYLEASQQRFSAEKVNADLVGAFSDNKHELHVKIYEDTSLRTPQKILDFLKDNSNDLPKNIQEALESENVDLEEKIMKGFIGNLLKRFEAREKRFEKIEQDVSKMTDSFAESVMGKPGWEKLDNDELLFQKEYGYLAQYTEIKKQLAKMPEAIADKFHKKLIGKFEKRYREQKGEIFKAQTEFKLQKSKENIDETLEEFKATDDPAKLSKKDLDNAIKNKLKNLDLFKNLPDEQRKTLDKELNALWEEKVGDFLKSQEEAKAKEDAKESTENEDKISRAKMKESWGSWTDHLKGYEKDFKSADDFRKSFIKKYFSNNVKDAEAYFEKHQNYAKSFEKSFQHYEKGQSDFFNKKINAVSGKLSDKRVSEAMKKSFKTAKNNSTKREWLKYLDKKVPDYEKEIKNSAKLEARLSTGFKKLKNHPQMGKIRQSFLLTQKNRKFSNNENRYIPPQYYEKELKILDSKFSAIESKDQEDRKKADKDISQLSAKNFDIKDQNIKSKEDFAKKSGINMPEYLWKEFGQDKFWEKINKVYPQYLEAKEGGLEKSPSVKFAKEVIDKLNHENLDFSRDFASQQSFNRQRHLRNQVSFAPEVWESVKGDFHKKSESLYARHQEIRKEMSSLSKEIKSLKSENLDFTKDYKSLREFSHQEGFFEFFKNQKASNIAYDQIKNSEFTPKVLDLYGDYLKQRDKPDASLETKKERDLIDNISIKDLDISQDFASFSEFKRQPFLRKTISFADDVWEKVQPNFEQKALALYSEQIQIREEQKKFEKALNTLTTDDLETDFEDFAGFVKQPAMRQFFTEINISDMAYDALTDDFAGKMDELWNSIKGNEEAEDFGEKDIQKLGTKHGLDFFDLPIENSENLGLKFERLDTLLTHSPSLAQFFRKKEEHIVPVFLSFLGEMNNEDFKRLDDDLGTTAKSPEEIVEVFFDSPRRKYLLSEVRKNDADSWRRLQIGEKSLQGLSIRDFVLNGNKDIEGEDLAEFEEGVEFDEEGNPILLEDMYQNIKEVEIEDLETEEDAIEESLEELSDEVVETDENVAKFDETDEKEITQVEGLGQSLDDVLEVEEEQSKEVKDGELEIKDQDENLKDEENEDVEIQEDAIEGSLEELPDEVMETDENVAEFDETDEKEITQAEEDKSIDEALEVENEDLEDEENEGSEIEEESERGEGDDVENQENQMIAGSYEIDEKVGENLTGKLEKGTDDEKKLGEEDEIALDKKDRDKEVKEDEEYSIDNKDEKETLGVDNGGADNAEKKDDEVSVEEGRIIEIDADEDLEDSEERVPLDKEKVKDEVKDEVKLEEKMKSREKILENIKKDPDSDEVSEIISKNTKDEAPDKSKQEVTLAKEVKEKRTEVEEEKKFEKEDIEKTEIESREKILENIKIEDAYEESLEDKKERIKEEQEMLRRILREEDFFRKAEKESTDDVLKDGEEDSLPTNVRDNVLQNKSPFNFAERHCASVMQLGDLLSKIHLYIELLGESKIEFLVNLSEKAKRSEIENPREKFLEIIDFLLEKDVFLIKKIQFDLENFVENKYFLRSKVNYLNNFSDRVFDFDLL